MNVLDLFAGIGQWSVGFERANCRTIAACELDPWKRKWLVREFPDARLYEDVRQLTGSQLAADGIVPDIIVGSPPCKEYSSANSKGRGLDGDDLFLEFVRLVGESGPDWACAENSPNIRTRGFDRIAREFERAGYESRAFILGAEDLGAPHIRKRAWIIANARGQRRRQISRGASGDEGADERRPAPPDYVAGGEPASDAADADRCDGNALGQSVGGYARPELTALGRAIGPAGLAWGGGPSCGFDLADANLSRCDSPRARRLLDREFRRIAAAAGDAILEEIAYLIARSILSVSA